MKSKFALLLGVFLFLSTLNSNFMTARAENVGTGGGKCKAICPDGSSCEATYSGGMICSCGNGGQGPANCWGWDKPKTEKFLLAPNDSFEPLRPFILEPQVK